MATVSYKAVAIAQNLLMNLQFQFPAALLSNTAAGELSAAWVLGTLSSGYPYLAASDATTKHQNIVVAVVSLLSVDTIWTDSLGNAAYPFTPTILQVWYEQSAGSDVPAAAGYVTVGSQIKAWGTLAQTGCQIQLFHTTNGNATLADALAVLGQVETLTAGQPDVTFDEYQYPGVASM